MKNDVQELKMEGGAGQCMRECGICVTKKVSDILMLEAGTCRRGGVR